MEMDSKSRCVCTVCGITFINSSNLRKHTRKFHSDRFEFLFGSKVRKQSLPTSEADFADGGLLVCGCCKKRFSTYCNLRAHVRKFHEDKLDVLAPKKLTNPNRCCEKCGKIFTNLIEFKAHHKQHKRSTAVANNISYRKCRFKCPLCSQTVQRNKDIIHHFDILHDIKIQSESIEFATLDQFQSWKNNMEKTTNAFYTILYTQKHIKGTNYKYGCHRSGSFASNGKGLRRSQGTNKINGFCPASLLVKLSDGKYTVQYTKTHVGHAMDSGRLRLTSFERTTKATKIELRELRNIRQRHKSSQQLDINSVIKSDVGWEVLSSSKREMYTVERRNQNICNCKLKCRECDACIHLYVCGCLDSSVKWNMCKHIHLVCTYRKTHPTGAANNFELQIPTNADEEKNLYIDQHSSASDSTQISESLSKRKTEDKDLNVERAKLMASLTDVIGRISSFEGLDAMKNIAASMNPVLDAVQNQIGTIRK